MKNCYKISPAASAIVEAVVDAPADGERVGIKGQVSAVWASGPDTTTTPYSGLPRAFYGSRQALLLFRAAQLEEAFRLLKNNHFTVVGTARALGLPVSSICGEDSMLNRYIRHGIFGLQRRGDRGAPSDLSRSIETLGWFIPAAQFFYFGAGARRGGVAVAVRRVVALPELPLGWRADTRARFLARLNLAAAPECPGELRDELLGREQSGKPIVPPRIARLIKTFPVRIRRHVIEASAEELARINLSAIAARLATLEPAGTCRLSIELL